MTAAYVMEDLEQTEEWTGILSKNINECESQAELMEVANDLYHFRNFKDALKYGIPAFRSRASQLGISTDTRVVAVDYQYIDSVDQLRKIFSTTKPTAFLFLVQSGIDGDRREDAIKIAKGLKPPHQSLSCLHNQSDMLSSIAFRAQLLGQYCVLVSSDKRLLQCLGAKTVILDPKTNEFTNKDRLLATHKITPQQVPDWLTIINHSVSGVTEELASEWLQAYKDVDGIAAHAANIKEIDKMQMDGFLKVYFSARHQYTLSKTASVTWQA